MTTIHRATIGLLTLLAVTAGYLITTATASAIPIEPGGGVQGGLTVPPAGTPTRTVITTGSEWWQFLLVAAAGAAFATLVAVMTARLRHLRSARAVAS